MKSASNQISSSLTSAFDPEEFRHSGHKVIDQLADYLKSIYEGDGHPVLKVIQPDTLCAGLPEMDAPVSTDDFTQLVSRILIESNHLHHPRYMGHQVSTPLPLTALCELVAGLLNNGSAIYEMGPVSTAMERKVISWMARLIGFGAGADGFLTSGGSAGNLTALLAARQVKAGYDLWQEGEKVDEPLAVLVSEQSHYCVKRAIQMMGWGANGLVPVAVDSSFRITRDGLESAFDRAKTAGQKVIAVVGNACSTQTGTYDPLDLIADFCEEHDLWFHVDGAHGASALVSDLYRDRLSGIHRADSVVWDAHKMLLMPALITAVIFKNGHHSYSAFSQKAAYLLQGEPQDEWFNLAHRTLECTKRMMSLKLYAAVSLYGKSVFEEYIDYTYGLTRQFAEMISASVDFEVPVFPQSNIICFRYCPQNGPLTVEDLDHLQERVRQQIVEEGSFYIVQTRLPQGVYLRCSLMNPLTKISDLEALLNRIRELFVATNHSIKQ